LDDLLARHGLDRSREMPFPTNGWSGATFSLLRNAAGDRFVLKRSSWANSWIVRATADRSLREAVFATSPPQRIGAATYLGAGSDGDGVAAILLPDLSAELLEWENLEHDAPIEPAVAERVVDDVARLHTMGWWIPVGERHEVPWCPLPERLTLLGRSAAEGYAAEGNAVGGRFLEGWSAFDRWAPQAARELVHALNVDPTPLVAALSRLPAVGLHGDLKLSNVAVFEDGRVGYIDWQMTLVAPVAVELGWFLVSNAAMLPFTPSDVLFKYRQSLAWHVGRMGVGDWLPRTEADITGDWQAQVDLAWIVGLVLRGWRKGLDAEAFARLPSGVAAAEDLADWCRNAVEAANRRL
jgi:hypothetical protein